MNNSIYGSKSQVYKGTAEKTKGGLYKKDIIRIKENGVVRYKSKDQQKLGRKKNTFRDKWAKAVKKARKQLIKEGVINKKEFIPVGGKSKEGKKLLKLVREIMG